MLYEPFTLSFRFFPNVSGYVARGRATCKFGREFCDNPVWPEAFRLRASARAHAGVCGRVAGIDLNRRPRDCTNARELAQPRARVATAGDASHHSHGKLSDNIRARFPPHFLYVQDSNTHTRAMFACLVLVAR
jgi:hypothetical protein